MLIAAYDNEPYAYFIPSDALLRDVGSAIPGSTGVIQEDCLPPSVHLPTAPTHRGEITPVQRQLYSARGAREDANVASSITISEDLPLKSLNEILDEETQSALWPKTPLAMTVAQRGELKAHLEKVSPIVEKAYKALETWYGCTKDVTRARRFIRFVSLEPP
ncbi:hypothetical protein B0T14DRAFT_86429 [Immersiella caudata]|uniref:Uncharacterized protein n=1 Tax=Immersiella caudata TaxID=314043 RepID=A0AA39XI48_9PEZI|nr:hypothetical protein B0T14DRAFT_86429 [Immersiella caudata]